MKFKQLVVLTFTLITIMTACSKSPQKYNSYNEYPEYTGNDLEYVYSPQQATFKLWSPEADSVQLHLYAEGMGGERLNTKMMEYVGEGVWAITINGDLKGKFYTFQVYHEGQWLMETVGGYAKAVGVNALRGAIIDMADTNPEGWENDVRPAQKNFTDIILYEVHVRDFSVSPNSGMKNKGKFLAFTEKGTKNSHGQATGLDHLKELGVTHVHLLPVFDFASIDETKLEENKYNWGYEPANFNVPEGSYSTNPYDPISRIKEFKQLVQTLHENGIRVIMDVVYNHTRAVEWSCFTHTVPGYYYRQNPDGSYANASGCGNETASERAMVRRYIVESLEYWAKEYHIDGFRFDLMAIHDIETMNLIRERLTAIDPTLFIYGEGWTAADSPLPYEERAVKQHVNRMPGIAVFSDDLRDGLRGGWADAKVPGFACGTQGFDETIKFGAVAATQHDSIHYGLVNYSHNPYAAEPSQVINYVSCHDDMCLNDKIAYSAPYGSSPQEMRRYNRLAQSVIFLSQGVPFIYAGEEIMRNKQGVHNTYQSPDSINQINWDFKYKEEPMFNYYKGLIALRNAHPAFRMPTTEMLQQNLHFLYTGQACVVAYTIENNANGDSWNRILVVHNGNRHPINLDIPQDNWTVACNGEEVRLNGIFNWNKNYLPVPASSTMVLFRK